MLYEIMDSENKKAYVNSRYISHIVAVTMPGYMLAYMIDGSHIPMLASEAEKLAERIRFAEGRR